MKKKVTLTIDGKKTTLGGMDASAEKLLSHLRKMRMGDYRSTEGLCKELAFAISTLSRAVKEFKDEFEPHRFKVQMSGAGSMVYGSVASINRLKKELEVA